MKHSFENPLEKEPRPDVKNLLARLEEYNNSFNWEGVLSRHIFGKIPSEKGVASDEELRRREKLEELKRDFREVLDKTGLTLEPIDASGVIFGLSDLDDEELRKRIAEFSEETGITRENLENEDSYEFRRAEQFMSELQEEFPSLIRTEELRLNISDAEKFLSFLNSFKDSEILPEEKESLQSIASILEKQFIEQYDVTDPNDERFLILIGSLGKIIDIYEGLGLGDCVAKLKELLIVAREKHLKEYLAIEKKGYLKPHSEGFGLAKWHLDMSPTLYNNRWNEALNTYRDTAKNPNGKELAERLRNHLLEAINIAREDIESSPMERDYEKKNFPEFLKTLEQAEKELK